MLSSLHVRANEHTRLFASSQDRGRGANPQASPKRGTVNSSEDQLRGFHCTFYSTVLLLGHKTLCSLLQIFFFARLCQNSPQLYLSRGGPLSLPCSRAKLLRTTLSSSLSSVSLVWESSCLLPRCCVFFYPKLVRKAGKRPFSSAAVCLRSSLTTPVSRQHLDSCRCHVSGRVPFLDFLRHSFKGSFPCLLGARGD